LSSPDTPAVPSRSSLPSAIDATRLEINLPGAGHVAFYQDIGVAGRPLLLVHSVNAAPSAKEMRPLFEYYRGRRPVYAPDLPGFGASERGDRPYSPTFFADALSAFIDEVIGDPPDVIALSLSAEFAARLLAQVPDKAASLVVISPTGLGRRRPPSGQLTERIERFLRLPGTRGLFRALTSRPSIRYFLKMAFEGPVPTELIDYAQATARQPGAHFAPFRFLSGRLFTPEAFDTLYLKVACPALILYDRDPNIGFERVDDLLAARPNWQAERIVPSLGLPHWELLSQTTDAIDRFWTRAQPTGTGDAPDPPPSETSR
jgi:pimeloyl-ACP methyl ester carboxylesterase